MGAWVSPTTFPRWQMLRFPMWCSRCPVRCGSRADIGAWMADVGGTAGFAGVRVPGMLPAGLPAFIPQAASIQAIARLDEHLRWPAYAVGLRRGRDRKRRV